MGYALGIDLGTTFSSAAVAHGGQVEIMSLGYRSPTVPSVIVVREGGEVLAGEAAERRALLEPLRAAREFKRRLGDPTPILIGGAPYSAEALMSFLLQGIYVMAVEQRGEPPSKLIVSYPANWGLYKLDLLEQAVRMADIEQAGFVTEPVAAALHYASRERIEPGEIVAVYDFGGGTFDAALLRRADTRFEPLGEPEGIERLGGIDFDEAVFGHVIQALSDFVADLDPSDSNAMSAVVRLREECRLAKEALSVDTDVTIPVILPNVQTEVRLTRGEFEEMVGPRIGATIAALRRSARSAGLDLSDVDKILLVGGSSRIPLVRQMVREETDGEVVLDAHPKHAIALGAALAADLGFGIASAARAAATAPTPPPRPPEPPIQVESWEIDVESGTYAGVLRETPGIDDVSVLQPATPQPTAPAVESDTQEFELVPAASVPTTREEPVPPHTLESDRGEQANDDTGRSPARSLPDAAGVASSQWADGIVLSPVLIGALVVVALGAAAATFLILRLLAG